MTTPVLRISVNGQDVSSKVNARVIKGKLDRHDGEKADSLSLTLSNFDGQLAKPARGASLSVALGFTEFGGAVDRGTYIVQTVKKSGPAAEFEITARSADLKKTLKEQKTRTFVAPKTLGDVLNQIASDNGLSPAIDAGLAAKPIDKIIAQTGESDMHLITRLARRYGAVGKFAMGKLVFTPKGSGTTASGASIAAITITPNDCESFTITDEDREDRGNSKAKVWDRAKATSTTLTGSAGGAGPDYTHPETFGSTTEAQAAVDARAKAFQRGTKKISAKLRASIAAPTPGGVITTQGFGDDDDTDWIVKTVSDEFGDEGLVTGFEGELKVADSGGSGGGSSASGASAATTSPTLYAGADNPPTMA